MKKYLWAIALLMMFLPGTMVVRRLLFEGHLGLLPGEDSAS